MSATRRGRPLVALYAERLCALRAGRNNFSFAQFSDLGGGAWSALVTEVAKVFNSDPENPVRCWEGS